MKVSDLAMMPLRWQSVRSPIIRLLMIKERARSGLAFDPFSPELHDDPYPLLAQLIERDPVHWLEAARGWLVTRHADVDALFRNPRFSADRSVLGRGVDAVWRRDSTIQATLAARPSSASTRRTTRACAAS